MSTEHENFSRHLSHPGSSSMLNFDDIYQIFNAFKYYVPNTHIEPKNDIINLFFYQYQLQLHQQMLLNSSFKESEAKKDILNTTNLQSLEKIQPQSDHTSRKKSKEEINQKRPVVSPNSSNEVNAPQKMVRGQEEWVNNSRNNNFISQILKCLECSASFDTLDDLSLHMLKSNHFSKFHPNQPLINPSRSTSPCQKKSFPYPNIKHKNSTFLVSKFTNENLTNQKSTNRQPVPGNCKKLTCKICKKNFQELDSSGSPLIELIQHLKNYHSINHICTNCGEFFENEKYLNEHLIAENYHLNNCKKVKNEQNSDLKTFSSSSTNSNSSSSNHPLLALQMFVNGSSELTTLVSPKSQKTTPCQKSPVQNLDEKSKLPAKKRPYFLEENKLSESSSHTKKMKIENVPNENYETKSQIEKNTNTQNNYQPLHLLQNMRLNLDEYFSR
ncbi:unnamed protein product [Brachionus calyciflorus]|uniref:C2H2-type domain-containing protein n=1 Tax=Brachionus calyciflorus TaxID=104777 RepID=A0A813QXH8_9BILA|nr:unnamed protein product [Brachionus calyciflorus]